MPNCWQSRVPFLTLEQKREKSKTMITEDKTIEPRQDEQEPQREPVPEGADDKPRPKRRFRLALLALIALILFGALLLAGVLPRLARHKKVTAAAQSVRDNIPRGTGVQAQKVPASSDLHLRGESERFTVSTFQR